MEVGAVGMELPLAVVVGGTVEGAEGEVGGTVGVVVEGVVEEDTVGVAAVEVGGTVGAVVEDARHREVRTRVVECLMCLS